ncbi:MAG TPA: hypothetical protein V6C71_06050 [Coleofasciculaceae cyanobacterium]|jgi:hypothetical protein
MLPGWVVSRTIPVETLVGLITGQYKLYGGVIRHAAGTPYAGQIIRHLIPTTLSPLGAIPGLNFIPGIIAYSQLNQVKEMNKFTTHQLMQMSGQISSLSRTTQQVLQIATGTAYLSGLGLTISCIGFALINKKLNTIDSKLKDIQKDIKAIEYFLESSERAKLRAALNALLKIDAKTAIEHRHTILHNSRNVLAEINMRYRELLSEADKIETATIYEEYFSLTALSQIRCTAELGMLDIACKEIEEINLFWQTQARRIAKEILVGMYPERFLATDFADDVSITELVEWLDFTYQENKGLCWIDELRLDMNEVWYCSWLKNNYSGLNKNKGIGIEREKKIIIPSLRKLIARSSIFESYTAQYELLEAQQIKPSDLEQQVANLPESSLVEGYLILESTQKEVVEVAV